MRPATPIDSQAAATQKAQESAILRPRVCTTDSRALAPFAGLHALTAQHDELTTDVRMAPAW